MAGTQGTKVIEIGSDATFEQTSSSLPQTCLQVIYFHAPWAEPCKQMSAVITTLASTYAASTPPSIAFLSVEAEEAAEVSERYDVTQVPFFVLQRGKEVLDSYAGSDASKVRDVIEKHADNAISNGTTLPPVQKVTPKPASNANASDLLDAKRKADVPDYLAPAAPAVSDSAKGPEHSTNHANQEQDKAALHKRLTELVAAAPVMLFMKGTPSAPQCGFSRQTVSILREHGIRYGFFNILADDDVRQGLKEFSEWPTFPQLYCGGELVGGLDILKEEFENSPDFMAEYSVQHQRKAAAA